MGSHEELERRVTAVEGGLAETRALAAGADRDVSDVREELRANRRVLVALRKTQLDHYAEHKADHAEVKAGLSEVKAGLSEVKAGVAVIVRMLEGMGGRADAG